ncbi:MAG: type II secretion system major pseudopilin GspG [Desulfatibacillaceae bacterium]|nr:type II secretion system major pseudopilin GspG [Desulfatibacillaceae bacterium]
MQKRPFFAKGQGFTLLELMAVIIILGILATFVVPRVMDKPERAKQSKAKVDLQALDTALNFFRLDVGRYPATEEGLEVLVRPPQDPAAAARWRRGGYLQRPVLPNDPWGRPYVYMYPGSVHEYDLLTFGADGQPGGEEFDADISIWDIE